MKSMGEAPHLMMGGSSAALSCAHERRSGFRTQNLSQSKMTSAARSRHCEVGVSVDGIDANGNLLIRRKLKRRDVGVLRDVWTRTTPSLPQRFPSHKPNDIVRGGVYYPFTRCVPLPPCRLPMLRQAFDE
jgi:hypothetical protein